MASLIYFQCLQAALEIMRRVNVLRTMEYQILVHSPITECRILVQMLIRECQILLKLK